MKTRHLTEGQIIDIYFLNRDKQGISNREIGDRLGGVAPATISQAKRYIQFYWQPAQASTRKYKTPYHKAVAKIKVLLMTEGRIKKKNEKKANEIVATPVEVKPTIDRFEKLDIAMKSFQHSIANYIQEEMDAQVSELKSENQALKIKLDKAETDIGEMESAFAKAKNSNWVDSIRASSQGKMLNKSRNTS